MVMASVAAAAAGVAAVVIAATIARARSPMGKAHRQPRTATQRPQVKKLALSTRQQPGAR
jgi:hypothetical protein